MTVREIMERCRKDEADIDFIDDYDESAWCAYCGTELTEEGEKEFSFALNLPVNEESSYYYGLFNSEIGARLKWDEQIIITCKNDKEVNALHDLLYSMSGYCSCDDYDRWFK